MILNGKSAIACAAVAAAAFAAVAAPFRMPPGASAEKPAGDAKGWHCNGSLRLSFQQAQRRLAALHRQNFGFIPHIHSTQAAVRRTEPIRIHVADAANTWG